MSVRVIFTCDGCGVEIARPPWSRNTLKYGHQVVCSDKCKDIVWTRDK